MTLSGKGKPNARVTMKIEGNEFIKWYVDRLRSHGKESLPAPPKNHSKFVERSGFPNRVYTFEDYDTDIEKRWWMCGKAETTDVVSFTSMILENQHDRPSFGAPPSPGSKF